MSGVHTVAIASICSMRLNINNCEMISPSFIKNPTLNQKSYIVLTQNKLHSDHALNTSSYIIPVTKSVLRRVRNSCMLVLRLCCVMVASQHVVDTRQMLYKYMILCKLCGHRPMNNTAG